MKYFAGPDLNLNTLKIGDEVTNEEGTKIPCLILNGGYVTIMGNGPDPYFKIEKVNSFGVEQKVFLTREEIALLYNYSGGK